MYRPFKEEVGTLLTSEDLEIFHVCEKMEREKSSLIATVVAVFGLGSGLFDSQAVQSRINITQPVFSW